MMYAEMRSTYGAIYPLQYFELNAYKISYTFKVVSFCNRFTGVDFTSK